MYLPLKILVGESTAQYLMSGNAATSNEYLPYVRCALGGKKKEAMEARWRPRGLGRTPVHHPPEEENLSSQALTANGNLASRHRRAKYTAQASDRHI